MRGKSTLSKIKKDVIEAKGFAIQVYTEDFENDYISLTDIQNIKIQMIRGLLFKLMRNRNTLEYIGLWKCSIIQNLTVCNSTRLEMKQVSIVYNDGTKWTEGTGAIGITSKSGRYGGTFAHYDIAMEFAS